MTIPECFTKLLIAEFPDYRKEFEGQYIDSYFSVTMWIPYHLLTGELSPWQKAVKTTFDMRNATCEITGGTLIKIGLIHHDIKWDMADPTFDLSIVIDALKERSRC